MDFLYDANGRPYSFYYNGTLYYYVLNLQGDVIQLLNSSGSLIANYSYDAWGKVTVSDIANGYSAVANANPLRYRGYYYDAETGFYYLQSRYYDPAICRFINADAFASTGQGVLGYNMFAYCNNNPVNYCDSAGRIPMRKNTVVINDGSTGFWEPPDDYVDITEQLNKEMQNNADELEEHYKNNGYVSAAFYFANKVKPGGDWDLKERVDWDLKPNTTYIYDNEVLRYDDIGNIHYGYVGCVLFSEELLLKAGGVVQIYTRTSDWAYWNSNFDDPRDQWAIGYGIQLWDARGVE